MVKLNGIGLKHLERICGVFSSAIGSDKLEPRLLSPLITSETLKKSGYEEHFPWQLLWTADSTMALKPSACFSVYENVEGTALDEPVEEIVCAPVYRTESKSDDEELRFNSFWMLEYVYVGDKSSVEKRSKELLKDASSVFRQFGINVRTENATDAFFLEESRGSKLLQQMKKLKTEYVSQVNGVSLGSINKHEDYFGKRFKITAGGEPAHSVCFALGVDRIAVELK